MAAVTSSSPSSQSTVLKRMDDTTAMYWFEYQHYDVFYKSEEDRTVVHTSDWEKVGTHENPMIVKDDNQIVEYLVARNKCRLLDKESLISTCVYNVIKKVTVNVTKFLLPGETSPYRTQYFYWYYNKEVVDDALKSTGVIPKKINKVLIEEASRLTATPATTVEEKKLKSEHIDRLEEAIQKAKGMGITESAVKRFFERPYKKLVACVNCPRMTRYDSTHQEIPLIDCVCNQATYCSEECRTAHMENGHKEHCDKIRPESRQARRKMMKEHKKMQDERQIAINMKPIHAPTRYRYSFVTLVTLPYSSLTEKDTFHAAPNIPGIKAQVEELKQSITTGESNTKLTESPLGDGNDDDDDDDYVDDDDNKHTDNTGDTKDASDVRSNDSTTNDERASRDEDEDKNEDGGEDDPEKAERNSIIFPIRKFDDIEQFLKERQLVMCRAYARNVDPSDPAQYYDAHATAEEGDDMTYHYRFVIDEKGAENREKEEKEYKRKTEEEAKQKKAESKELDLKTREEENDTSTMITPVVSPSPPIDGEEETETKESDENKQFDDDVIRRFEKLPIGVFPSLPLPYINPQDVFDLVKDMGLILSDNALTVTVDGSEGKYQVACLTILNPNVVDPDRELSELTLTVKRVRGFCTQCYQPLGMGPILTCKQCKLEPYCSTTCMETAKVSHRVACVILQNQDHILKEERKQREQAAKLDEALAKQQQTREIQDALSKASTSVPSVASPSPTLIPASTGTTNTPQPPTNNAC